MDKETKEDLKWVLKVKEGPIPEPLARNDDSVVRSDASRKSCSMRYQDCIWLTEDFQLCYKSFVRCVHDRWQEEPDLESNKDAFARLKVFLAEQKKTLH
jgi:hypothetical protein